MFSPPTVLSKPRAALRRARPRPREAGIRRIRPCHRKTRGFLADTNVMAHLWIALKIQRSGWFQNTTHFDQANRHIGQIGLCAFPVREPGGGYRAPTRRVVRLDILHPFTLDVVKGPGILEHRYYLSPLRQRCRVISIRVKWRIKIDQINAGRVHSAHNIEVIRRPQSPIFPVEARQVGKERQCPSRLQPYLSYSFSRYVRF